MKFYTVSQTLIVSGINHGANIGIKCIVFRHNVCRGRGSDGRIFLPLDFRYVVLIVMQILRLQKSVVKNVVEHVLKNGMMDRTCLNVNIPEKYLLGN